MVICLERDADLHMAQLMQLPLTVSCFSKIQIGFTFLAPAHPGSPGKRAVKRVFVFHLLKTKSAKFHKMSPKKSPKFINTQPTSILLGLAATATVGQPANCVLSSVF